MKELEEQSPAFGIKKKGIINGIEEGNRSKKGCIMVVVLENIFLQNVDDIRTVSSS